MTCIPYKVGEGAQAQAEVHNQVNQEYCNCMSGLHGGRTSGV